MSVSLSRAQALADAAPQIGRREARELLLHVCACSHAELIARGDVVLADDEAVRYADLVARCAAGEPLAYLLGSAWFAGREFAVSPAVDRKSVV